MTLYFSSDHRPERSTFCRISIGAPILLESTLGCFQRVPLLSAIVFEAFFVTRQHRRFYGCFPTLCEFFLEYFLCRQRVPSLGIWIFCNQRDEKNAQRVLFCIFWHKGTFLNKIFNWSKCTTFTLLKIFGLKKVHGERKVSFSAL